MLVKAFGIIDLIAGMFLIFGVAHSSFNSMMLAFGVIVMVKSGMGFFRDFAGWIDIFAGIILLLSLLISVPGIISFIAGLLIAQKGIFSFL